MKLHEWLEDPTGNNEILSNVIDMKSFARWFLLQEVAKEHDGYVASMVRRSALDSLNIFTLTPYPTSNL